ncbi:hypothetical protein LZ189_19820, partial [Rhodovulum sulfidophilum]|nr:hypothetical protein [Rhodovulum sulfidophilum]
MSGAGDCPPEEPDKARFGRGDGHSADIGGIARRIALPVHRPPRRFGPVGPCASNQRRQYMTFSTRILAFSAAAFALGAGMAHADTWRY